MGSWPPHLRFPVSEIEQNLFNNLYRLAGLSKEKSDPIFLLLGAAKSSISFSLFRFKSDNAVSSSIPGAGVASTSSPGVSGTKADGG